MNYYEGDDDPDAEPEYRRVGFIDNWRPVYQKPSGEWIGGGVFFSLEAAVNNIQNKVLKTNFIGWDEEY